MNSMDSQNKIILNNSLNNSYKIEKITGNYNEKKENTKNLQ